MLWRLIRVGVSGVGDEEKAEDTLLTVLEMGLLGGGVSGEFGESVLFSGGEMG